MRGRLKGLQEVKTLAGTGGPGVRPKERHVLQFKIGSLELELTRRLKEKATALERIREIDARISQIDLEIRKHHENLGYGGSPTAARDAASTQDGAPGSAQTRRTIRYGS